jgi:hypothetical protein
MLQIRIKQIITLFQFITIQHKKPKLMSNESSLEIQDTIK